MDKKLILKSVLFMKTILLNNPDEIIHQFKEGKVLVFPSETSYGLGCDARNQKAVDKIFKIKNRSERKPLLVVVDSVEMAKKCLVWNETIDKLAKKYWPGPLTIIGQCSKDSCLAKGVITESRSIAVRVTAHPFLKKISESLGCPIVATSANISDAREIYNSYDIIKCFSARDIQPDILVDAGLLPVNKPTTVVDASKNEIKVLRKGVVDILI